MFGNIRNTDSFSVYKLLGNVDSMIETIHNINGEIPEYSKTIAKFDKNNRLLEESYLIGDSLEEISTSKTSLHNKFENFYDNQQNLTSIMQYERRCNFNGGYDYKLVNTLNNMAHFSQVEVKSYLFDGALNSVINYEIDEFGNNTQVKHYNEIGDLKSQTNSNFQYDKMGNVIDYRALDIDGNILFVKTTTYRYDELFGLELSRENFLNGKLENRTVNCYNDVALLVEKTHHDNAKITSRVNFEYDENSNIISEKFTSENPMQYDLRLSKYDSEGNWIIQKTYNCKGINADLKLTCVKERKLVYR